MNELMRIAQEAVNADKRLLPKPLPHQPRWINTALTCTGTYPESMYAEPDEEEAHERQMAVFHVFGIEISSEEPQK